MSVDNRVKPNTDIDDLGLFRGHPVTDLLQLLTYREDKHAGGKRGYYLSADGAFWMVYQLRPFERDTMSADQCAGVSTRMMHVLNSLPEGVSGQIIRYTHGDVSDELMAYVNEETSYPSTSTFADSIQTSVVQRQLAGAREGFFASVDSSAIETAQQDALDAASSMEDPDFTEALSENIATAMYHGRYARKMELFLAVRYEPEWVTKRMSPVHSVLQSTKKALFGNAESTSIRSMYKQGLQAFFSMLDDFEQSMITIGQLNPRRTGVQSLLRVLYREFNPRRYYDETPDDGLPHEPAYRPDLTIREQLLNNDEAASDIGQNSLFSPITLHDWGWTIDGLHYRPVSLGACPAYVSPRMLDKRLLELDFDGWVVINFHVLKRWRMKALIKARQDMFDLVSGVKEYVPFMGARPEINEARREQFQGMLTAVDPEIENSQSALNVSLHCVLRDDDRDELERKATSLEHALFRKGVKEDLHGAGVIYSCLPGNMRPAAQRATQRDLPLLAMDVAEMLPVYDGFYGSVSSHSILLNNTQGSPIFMDFWDDNAPAPHFLLLGGTGSGKSFCAQNLMQQMSAKQRMKQFIIDKGESFKETVIAQGGNYITLQLSAPEGKRVCINPLYIPPNSDQTPRTPDDDELEFMVSVLISMAGTGTGGGIELRLSKADRNLCADILRDLFQERYERLVQMMETDPEGYSAIARTDQLHLTRDVITRMEDGAYLTQTKGEDFAKRARDFASVITDYSKDRGFYGALFDGDLSLEWDNDIIGFETDQVANLPCFSTIMMVLFYQISMYCKHRLPQDMRKMIVMDECWSGLSDPVIAGRLAAWIYEMRKFSTSVGLITQALTQLNTLLKAEANAEGGGKAGGLLNNISHFITLSCTSADHELGRSVLEMSDEDVEAWASVSSLPPYYTEFLYRFRAFAGGFVSGKVRLYSNPISLWLSTTLPKDKQLRTKRIQHYLDQGYSEDDASKYAIESLADEYPFGSKFPPRATSGKDESAAA